MIDSYSTGLFSLDFIIHLPQGPYDSLEAALDVAESIVTKSEYFDGWDNTFDRTKKKWDSGDNENLDNDMEVKVELVKASVWLKKQQKKAEKAELDREALFKKIGLPYKK
jgi:hypothetical protein